MNRSLVRIQTGSLRKLIRQLTNELFFADINALNNKTLSFKKKLSIIGNIFKHKKNQTFQNEHIKNCGILFDTR